MKYEEIIITLGMMYKQYVAIVFSIKKNKNQNDKHNPENLWHSKDDFSVWCWMRDHKNPNIRWMYTRVQIHTLGPADISDCGMLYYLLVDDDYGNPEKFSFFRRRYKFELAPNYTIV